MKQLIIVLFLGLVIFSCKTNKQNIATSTIDNGLIKDCPEELINNQMPIVGKSEKRTSRYYIYKGLRKEIKDFDSAWVSKNCNVKEIVVQ
ncbi:MAG: hypothetical protein V4677_13140 [Bacteroidota bacterium]